MAKVYSVNLLVVIVKVYSAGLLVVTRRSVVVKKQTR